MKKIIFVFLVCLAADAQAQEKTTPDTTWKTGGLLNINFSQASFSNWAAGGENSFSVTGLFSAFAKYKKGKNTWENTLDLAYGKLQLGSARSLRKSDDKIDLSSKFGHQIDSKKLYYALLFNFKSQFDNGYIYPNDSVVASHFAAPAYFLLALGIDYKPNDYFSAFLSPATGKITLVNDQRLADAGAFGVKKAEYDANGLLLTHGEKTLTEFGGYARITFKKDIVKNVNLGAKLELFSNYLKNPQNIVVNAELLIGMKVNKYISASLGANLIYDDKVIIQQDKNGDGIYEVNGPRTQFKEVIAIGFSYKF